jgi:hypothetical protein
MSAARNYLIGRIEAITAILSSPVSVDTVPVPTPNSAAVVVRNGCMVMLFCALEGFLRERSLECASQINQTSVPYAHLPEGLRYASLIATFEGLLNSSRYWSTTDKVLAFEAAAVAAASGKLGSAYQFTDYSFARDKSNVGADDISKIAKEFGVTSFWNEAMAVSQIIEMALPENMDAAFRQLARARHKAAHVPSHNTPHSDLLAAIPKAIAVALSFDVLVSTAVDHLNRSNVVGGVVVAPITRTDVKFIYVRPHKSGWAAYRSPPSSRDRAIFVEGSHDVAMARASALATNKNFCLVSQDGAGRAANWRTCVG